MSLGSSEESEDMLGFNADLSWEFFGKGIKNIKIFMIRTSGGVLMRRGIHCFHTWLFTKSYQCMQFLMRNYNQKYFLAGSRIPEKL